MNNFYFEILDKKRKSMLPIIKRFKDRFYLAGGTGLALQIGHRDSIDFDFFTDQEFDPEKLLREIKKAFSNYSIEVIQSGNMTLNLIIADEVRVSFFRIKEKMLKPFMDTEYLNIASIDDIACMKMAALLRAEFKDYVDLFYIFKQMSLNEIIDNCKEKYKDFNEMVYLKALTSFDDINVTDILFRKGKQVKLKDIKKDFGLRVKQYLASL